MQHQPIDWPSVIFTAEATRSPFEDAEVISTRQQYTELARLAAVETILKNQYELTLENVEQFARAISDQSKIFVQEYVEIGDEGNIIIGVDTLDIDSEQTLFHSLDMLKQALDALDGKPGTVYFGEKLQYQWNDVISYQQALQPEDASTSAK